MKKLSQNSEVFETGSTRDSFNEEVLQNNPGSFLTAKSGSKNDHVIVFLLLFFTLFSLKVFFRQRLVVMTLRHSSKC